MNKYKTGIYVGKFMPFHNEHLNTVLKLSKCCDKVYMVFYNDESKEKKLALEFNYPIDERVEDAKEVLKNTNIEVVNFKVPSNINFPEDYQKLKKMLFDQIGEKNIEVQIFGKSEEYIYKDYIYADKYILSDNDNTKLDNDIELHATLIRKNYNKYSRYLPSVVRERLDKRYKE